MLSALSNSKASSQKHSGLESWNPRLLSSSLHSAVNGNDDGQPLDIGRKRSGLHLASVVLRRGQLNSLIDRTDDAWQRGGFLILCFAVGVAGENTGLWL
jgi:hypothetical protein